VLRVPKAPDGKMYDAWVIRGPSAKSAGLFDGGDGTSVVSLSRHVPRDAVVGVTVERAGGADQPTQKPFVTSAEQS
jgi:anti-sigma-K factor RskA